MSFTMREDWAKLMYEEWRSGITAVCCVGCVKAMYSRCFTYIVYYNWNPSHLRGQSKIYGRKVENWLTHTHTHTHTYTYNFLFKFYCCTHGLWKFPGQGLNLICSFSNARSFYPLCQARDRKHASTVTQATTIRFLTHCIKVGTSTYIFKIF